MKQWANKVWISDDYIQIKKNSFELIDSFLDTPPINILDIGCGFAYESEFFQKKYNSNLYLLDGDFDDNPDTVRDRKYSETDPLAFYTRITDLEESYRARNLKYQFLNANNLMLDQKIIFDLVYSNVSCGYHYPLGTYLDFLKLHTDRFSILIFDMHTKHIASQIKDKFEIIDSKPYPGQTKIIKCKIRIL